MLLLRQQFSSLIERAGRALLSPPPPGEFGHPGTSVSGRRLQLRSHLDVGNQRLEQVNIGRPNQELHLIVSKGFSICLFGIGFYLSL